jgi:hypothetical protein
MSSIMIDTRPTNVPSPGQPNPLRTKFIIENNSLGVNTDCNVRVNKSFDTYQTDNIICNNNGDVKVESGVSYTKNCHVLQK